ncbi:MAG: hypothetical protein R3179_08420 [Sedimenticolaceae bacterium]|nr:hypothetical protein [Sedimenticolaceae bacterium]
MASKWTWIAALLLLAGLVIFFVTPPADQEQSMQRTDLPWQVSVDPDGSSRVFDLHIGTSTLQDAIAKFGNPEAVALYIRESGTRDLETYFGTVSMGPLKAKIILNLLVDGSRLDVFEANAIKQEYSAEGHRKLLLNSEDKQTLGDARIAGITYIPTYKGLEADFFRERFGEPAAWKVEDEEHVQWFYPDIGLTLLMSAEGREILQYRMPRDFVLPEGVESESTGTAAPGGGESGRD